MWDNFTGWLRQPFSADMTALDWFLFLGLMAVLTAIWSIIFKHLEEASK